MKEIPIIEIKEDINATIITDKIILNLLEKNEYSVLVAISLIQRKDIEGIKVITSLSEEEIEKAINSLIDKNILSKDDDVIKLSAGEYKYIKVKYSTINIIINILKELSEEHLKVYLYLIGLFKYITKLNKSELNFNKNNIYEATGISTTKVADILRDLYGYELIDIVIKKKVIADYGIRAYYSMNKIRT